MVPTLGRAGRHRGAVYLPKVLPADNGEERIQTPPYAAKASTEDNRLTSALRLQRHSPVMESNVGALQIS